MLKRPSSRRKKPPEQIQLNLVPILDTMVTLISFLLFTMALIAFVNIESPFPEASSQTNQEALKEKPLQLTLTLRDNEVEIWSPFEKIPAQHIPNIQAQAPVPGASPTSGTAGAVNVGNPSLPANQPDVKTIHEAMISIKQKFPVETKIVFVPNGGSTYDILIAVMDSVRLMEPTDPPMFAKNAKTGNDEPVKILFPEVIFGNLLGGG